MFTHLVGCVCFYFDKILPTKFPPEAKINKFLFNSFFPFFFSVQLTQLRMRDLYTNPSKRNESSNLEFSILRNKSTKQILGKQAYETNPRNESLEKQAYKTNPWYESLRFGFANPPAWICKDSFRAIVLRIHQDSWGFIGFVKTGRIFESSGHETNPWFESLRIGLANLDSRICEVGFVNHKTKQIFLKSGFVTTIRNESTFLRISYTIPASLNSIQISFVLCLDKMLQCRITVCWQCEY